MAPQRLSPFLALLVWACVGTGLVLSESDSVHRRLLPEAVQQPTPEPVLIPSIIDLLTAASGSGSSSSSAAATILGHRESSLLHERAVGSRATATAQVVKKPPPKAKPPPVKKVVKKPPPKKVTVKKPPPVAAAPPPSPPPSNWKISCAVMLVDQYYLNMAGNVSTYFPPALWGADDQACMYTNLTSLFPDITGKVKSMTVQCTCTGVADGDSATSCYNLARKITVTFVDKKVTTSGDPIGVGTATYFDVELPPSDPASADPYYTSTGNYCQGGKSCGWGYASVMPRYGSTNTWGTALQALKVCKCKNDVTYGGASNTGCS